MVGSAVKRAVRQAFGFDSYLLWYCGLDAVRTDGLRFSRLLVDVIDPPYDRESAVLSERELAQSVQRADLFLATAPALGEQIGAAGGDTVTLRNGCAAPPDSPAGTPAKPTVGYVGTLDSRLDYPLLTAVARQLPEVEFLFTGRVEPTMASGLAELERGPNVSFTGPRLPPSFDDYTIGTIPFRRGRQGDSINPCKMYEYFAHGLPVLSTSIAECAAEPLVRCADTPEAWVQTIRELLAAPRGDARVRMELAGQNTWATRAADAAELLVGRGLLSPAAVAAGGAVQ